MSDTHIRRTRRSKRYMAPVLLDHASMKRLMLSMMLALVVVFLSGYVVGFEKAEVRLASSVNTEFLALPETVVEVPASMEPVVPLKAEPGEMIDVDIADAESTIISKQSHQSEHLVAKNAELASVSFTEDDKIEPVILPNTDKQVVIAAEPAPVYPSAMGGPAATDPEQGDELLIQDTANEENASYSVQVGMYSQLGNAEQKVEELVMLDLSAYLTDYMSKRNEIRYNVRFGYFADRRSARKALATFEKEFSGSGYVVRLSSPTKVSVNTGEHSDG